MSSVGEWRRRVKPVFPTKEIEEEVMQLAIDTKNPVIAILDGRMLLDEKETSVHQVYFGLVFRRRNKPCNLCSSALIHIFLNWDGENLDDYISFEIKNMLKEEFPEVFGYLLDHYKTESEVNDKVHSYISYLHKLGLLKSGLGRYGNFYFISKDDVKIKDYRI